MSLSKALLCTLGPSSLNREVIPQLDATGATAFRINLSHTDLDDLDGFVRLIRSSTRRPIYIDTEGAQIRTGRMREGTAVEEGERVRLVPEGVEGDPTTIPLRPGGVVEELASGTRLSIDYDSVVVEVDSVGAGIAGATVVTGGEIGTRKSVTAFPSPQLPVISEKDALAIRYAVAKGIRHFALSFCHNADGVREIRELIGPKGSVIAKIESREGVRHLPEIVHSADAILIDRGDLSREVRLQAIPFLQKQIIHEATAAKTPVYVATNLLESMMARRAPTRAEVNDVINTLLDGADGLVLAQETAIGRYPVRAARMIAALIHEYESELQGYGVEDLLGHHPLEVKASGASPPSGAGGTRGGAPGAVRGATATRDSRGATLPRTPRR